MKRRNKQKSITKKDVLLEEARRIEEELGTDLEYPESDEEVEAAYQRMLARIEAEKNAERSERMEIPAELYREFGDFRSGMAPSEEKHRKISRKLAGLKSLARVAAYVGITLVGLFAVTMSTQGGREWVTKRVNYMVGDGVIMSAESGIDVEDLDDADAIEIQARTDIEEQLEIVVPQFSYRPTGFYFYEYSIFAKRKIATISFGKDSVLTLYMQKGLEDFNGLVHPHGHQIKLESFKVQDIVVDVYEEKLDENSCSYIADWEYEDCYYELAGKMEREKFIKVVKNIRIAV